MIRMFMATYQARHGNTQDAENLLNIHIADRRKRMNCSTVGV